MSHNEVGEFLRARRAELTPREVGLPEFSPRRLKGLRREEVAQLAAISTDYYARLEQGRVRASAAVLAGLARALRLGEDERAYLTGLIGKPPVRARRRTGQVVRPALQRILDQLTDSPAMLLGRRLDILAWNPLAAAVLTDFSQIPEDQRNYVRLIFTDPKVRGALTDWAQIARMCVDFLRMQATDYLDDPRLASLVGDLSLRDPDFRQWWAAHHVISASTGTKRLYHPVAGEITVDWELLACSTDSEQKLLVWTAEPNSPSHEALRFLASWAAERAQQVQPRANPSVTQ
jgi:transcriptional regulator with XRE-family HTH domain